MNPDQNGPAEANELENYRRVFFASPDFITFSRMSDGLYIDVNPVFERFTGIRRAEAIGRSVLTMDLWVDTADRKVFVDELLANNEIHGFRSQLRNQHGEVRDVEASATVSTMDGEKVIISIVRDITDRKRDEDELERYRSRLEQLVEQRTGELQHAVAELRDTNLKLEQAHNQLLQTEKMASIGQLAAGVAHEINNPIGFVNSNLGSLGGYFRDLLQMIDAYQLHEDALAQFPERLQAIQVVKTRIDLDYVREDVGALLAESADGMLRVKKIVQDLKDFSHVGAAEWQWANIHAGIDSTLNIANNEIKYRATVAKEYGNLPDIECLPLELNQVFMNMLVNAAQAIESFGQITIRTGLEGAHIWIEFRDNGPGIAPENITRIYDPFFTTKPIGKGTGLGLSLSYGIVQKHQGRIEVDSVLGQGTCFKIWLPLKQSP